MENGLNVLRHITYHAEPMIFRIPCFWTFLSCNPWLQVIAESDRTQLKEVNYHGSVILQNLLQFGNPEAIVTSILDMEPTELTTLACHKFGSHVIDAFLKSTTAGEKSRALLYNKLKVNDTQLCTM